MSQAAIDRLEEKLAYQEKTIDELSEVIAAQARQIDLIEARLRRLMEREATRETEGTGGVILGDERPPHY